MQNMNFGLEWLNIPLLDWFRWLAFSILSS